MDGILNLLDGEWWSHGFLSPSTAVLYPAPQPPTSLLSSSSAWSSAGRLPIIPSYTSQPPLKIFSVLTQKYVIRQKYFSHKIPQPTSVLSKMCCRVSPLVCVEDVGAGDHVSSVRPRGCVDRQFLAPGKDSDGVVVGRCVNCNGDIVRTLYYHLVKWERLVSSTNYVSRERASPPQAARRHRTAPHSSGTETRGELRPAICY